MLMVEVCNRKALGFDSQFTTKAINSFKSGFLNLSPTDILYWKFFVMEAVWVHCRVFKSIPGLCGLDASSTHSPTICDNQKLSIEIIKVPAGAKSTLIETN